MRHPPAWERVSVAIAQTAFFAVIFTLFGGPFLVAPILSLVGLEAYYVPASVLVSALILPFLLRRP